MKDDPSVPPCVKIAMLGALAAIAALSTIGHASVSRSADVQQLRDLVSEAKAKGASQVDAIKAALVSRLPHPKTLIGDGSTSAQTKYGTMVGTLSEKNRTRNFLGVPFAQPPVGPLRWKSPANISAFP